MAKLGDLVVRIGADTRDLNKSLGKVQRNMRSMTSNFKKLGSSMTKSITLPLAAVAGASLKLAVDFEGSMAKVKAVTGATVGEFKSLEETAKKLGATTVFTASEVAGLMLEYGKLGFSTKQIEDAAEATLLLAQATGSDLVQAAEVAGSTLGGFGLAATETGRLADVMAAAFTGSALDIDKFKDSMKFVAPVAKAAGVSLEEASSMLATLADSGIKGSQAGTALRRILQELSGESGTVTEKLQKLSNKGLGVKDAFDEVGRNASSALLVLSEGVADVESFTTELENSGGAAKAMADIMNDTAAGSLKKLTSALEGAALVIGDALAPMMESLANFVADLAGSFRELEPGTQKIVILFGALLAALGPMLLILPQIIAALPLIAGAFAAMTGPIGLAVIGVTALIGTVAALVKANKDIPSTLERANQAVRDHSTEVRYLVGQYKDETKSLEDRKRILGRLAEIDATHFGNLEAEKTTYNDLVKNLDAYTASLRRNYLEKILAEEGSDIMAELVRAEDIVSKKRIALQKAKDEERGQDIIDAYQLYLDSAKIYEQTVLTRLEAHEKKKQDLLEKYASKTTPTPETGGGGGGGGAGGGVVIIQPEQMELLEKLPPKLIAVNKPLKTLQDSGTETIEIFKEVSQTMIDVADSFGNSFGQMISGAQTAKEAFRNFAISAIRSVLAVAKANVIANATSTTNLANLFSGGLTSPGFALIGLAALDVLAQQIPALAEGGLIYGPSLALVGDNKNASIDPEVVAPLSKLKGMLGGNAVEVYGRISGDDIVLSNSRASRDRNRF